MKILTIQIVLCMFLLQGNGTLIAETISTAIEEAVYTENTLGNLDQAIKLYEQILSDVQTSPAYKAIVKNHLKAAYKKKGDTEKLLLLNKTESTEFLTSAGNSQKSIAELASHNNSSIEALELLPIPWKNGQTYTFKVFLSHIEGIGIATANIAEIDGRKYWVFEEVIRNTGLIDRYARVFVEIDSFKPVKALMKNKEKSFEIDYMSDGIKITQIRQWWNKSQYLPLVNNIYDVVQSRALVQRLPLRPEYEAVYSILAPDPGAIHQIKITVSDTERVKVPLGLFECYLVTVEHNALGYWQSAGTLWADINTNKVVKSVTFVNMGAIRELESVSINPAKITDFNSGAIQPKF